MKPFTHKGMNEIMSTEYQPCGHKKSSIRGNGTTQYCIECEGENRIVSGLMAETRLRNGIHVTHNKRWMYCVMCDDNYNFTQIYKLWVCPKCGNMVEA